MKSLFTALLLIVTCTIFKAQEAKHKTIKVKKQSCCDSITVGIADLFDGQLKENGENDIRIEFGAKAKGCKVDSKVEIISYVISLDNGDSEFNQGAIYERKSHIFTPIKDKIILTNCIVKCTEDGREAMLITLPKQVIHTRAK